MSAHYFKQLTLDLKQQGIATPQLIVDQSALNHNIQYVQQQLVQRPDLLRFNAASVVREVMVANFGCV